MTGSIRVLVVDDHPIVRQGLRALLATESGIELVGEARDGLEGVMEAARLSPDVVLMDLVMPEVDGIEAIERIVSAHPQTRLLVLTSFDTEDKIFSAIRAGAHGYILKDSGPVELVNAIRQIYRGESALHPIIARKVLHEMAHPPQAPPTPDPLTMREVEVLRLVGQGESNPAIASTLGISESTVRTHVSSILSKLHLASRTQVALYAVRAGFTRHSNEGGAE